MQKKQCPNGHVYDPSIYGDSCPLCPQGTVPPVGANDTSSPKTHLAGGPAMGGGPAAPAAPVFGGPSVGGPADMKTHIGGAGAGMAPNRGMAGGFGAPAGMPDASGATQMRPQEAEPRGGGRTVIRRAPGAGPAQQAPERRLVGFLVTYNRNPAGRAYNLYEGRNYIGRDASCDISLPDDGQMSGKHLSILYRNADGKFKFRDEQSSNGTFVNKELLDDGELQNYDIIRAGSTIFIFIAIPTIR